MPTLPSVRTFTDAEILTASYLNNPRDVCQFLAFRPMCSVSFPNAIIIATSTATAVLWTTEYTTPIPGTEMHSNTVNPSRFTPTYAGWYVLSASIFWTSGNVGYRQVAARKNGLTIMDEDDRINVGSSGMASNFHSDAILCNGTTDYLEVVVWQNHGTNLGIGNTSVATCMFVAAP